MNQRVVAAKITFTEFDARQQRYDPTISIDSFPYENEKAGPIESITVSRVIKYQNDEGHSVVSKKMLKDGLKKECPEFIDKKCSYEETLKFMQNILSSQHTSELQL